MKQKKTPREALEQIAATSLTEPGDAFYSPTDFARAQHYKWELVNVVRDAKAALESALQQQPEPDKRRVAMETVYFRRGPNEPWDSLTVLAGTATQHVREELIESIVSAADGIAASPSTTQQQEAGSDDELVELRATVRGLNYLVRTWRDRAVAAGWTRAPAAPSTPAREEAGLPAVDSQTNPPADEGAT